MCLWDHLTTRLLTSFTAGPSEHALAPDLQHPTSHLRPTSPHALPLDGDAWPPAVLLGRRTYTLSAAKPAGDRIPKSTRCQAARNPCWTAPTGTSRKGRTARPPCPSWTCMTWICPTATVVRPAAAAPVPASRPGSDQALKLDLRSLLESSRKRTRRWRIMRRPFQRSRNATAARVTARSRITVCRCRLGMCIRGNHP